MDAFCSGRSNIKMGPYTRDEVEDFTGRNPRLIASCIQNREINFDCPEVNEALRQSRMFAKRIRCTSTAEQWLQ
jgi:hypothetical protein